MNADWCRSSSQKLREKNTQPTCQGWQGGTASSYIVDVVLLAVIRLQCCCAEAENFHSLACLTVHRDSALHAKYVVSRSQPFWSFISLILNSKRLLRYSVPVLEIWLHIVTGGALCKIIGNTTVIYFIQPCNTPVLWPLLILKRAFKLLYLLPSEALDPGSSRNNEKSQAHRLCSAHRSR